MKLRLTVKVIIAIVAVGVAVSGAFAGYWHDQSIKGVYSQLDPQIYSLKDQVTNRNAQVSNLQNQIAGLNSQVSTLQQQIASLNSQLTSEQQQGVADQVQIANINNQLTTAQQTIATDQQLISQLRTQVANLQAPSLDGVFTFTGGGCFFGCSATLRGAWTNYGTLNARSSSVTLTWSYQGTFVQSNTINIGVVAGQSISLYPDTPYSLASQVDHVDWAFTWTT
jgi:ACT domain-containing protein